MTISSKDLIAYLPSLTFPVQILAEKFGDDRVMMPECPYEVLMFLINRNGVIGQGTKHRIKRLRLNSAAPSVVKAAEEVIRETQFSRESLKYFYRETVIENQPYVLKRLKDGAFVHWTDKDGFTPRRFNPDRIARPLTPCLGNPV